LASAREPFDKPAAAKVGAGTLQGSKHALEVGRFDTTTRTLQPETRLRPVVSDTVGFIHQFGEAYKRAEVLSKAYDDTGRVLNVCGLPTALARLPLNLDAR
jgi:hypothetical protein